MKRQIFLIAMVFWGTNMFAQMYNEITRGHFSGEIYMSSIWYEPSYMEERYDAVFYSSDNGETIGIRYALEVYSTEMPIGNLITDATPGVIYDFYLHNFWISYDYGYSWSNLNTPGNWTETFTSGGEEGVIYMYWEISGLRLERSNDYGETFTLVNNNPAGGRPEVGSEVNEIYLLSMPSSNYLLKIWFSNNRGIDFTLQCELDSTIGGYVVWGQNPVISRGCSPGELYLVTWHDPANYHIYHSTDYGQTFEQRFVSDSCNLLEARYCFTAGVEPGSFYVKYSIPWVDGVNTEMHILYSSDTAHTFTDYYHFLDENFPTSINEGKLPGDEFVSLKIYPNPATGKFEINNNGGAIGECMIEIFDQTGRKVLDRKIYIGQQGTEILTEGWEKGLYLVRIKSSGKIIAAQKVMVI